MNSLLSNSAETTSILYAMKDYDRPIPVHFLARIVGRQPAEIQAGLRFLVDQKIVSVDGEMVSLVKTHSSQNRIPAAAPEIAPAASED